MLRCLAISWLLASTALAGGAPLIELTSSGKPIQGRQLASNKTVCWLTDIDGRLLEVRLSTVTDFRVVSPEFKPRALMDLRKALSAEFGAGYEVAVKGRYVVVGPRGKAEEFARLLDQTSREFLQYLKVRRFQITEPDLPLVAVVYATRAEFAAQCARDSVQPSPSLRGYYHRESNRVTLYDDPLASTLAASKGSEPADRLPTGADRKTPHQLDTVLDSADPSAMARDTAVHEAIHQLAFNAGLHSRVGENPHWVVEGLAMQFERGDERLIRTRTSSRVNLPRLAGFEAYRRERRQGGAVARMIAGDDFFKKSPLDAYSEAWLFMNYLMETRPQKLGWYLQTLAARNPLDRYPAEERLRDFESNFGEDLAWLEVEFLRYAEKLTAEAIEPAATKKR